MIQTITWIAIGVLAASYWLQVWKIHKHREVRDISGWTYAFLLVGYFALLTKASIDWHNGTGDIIWIFRQMATIVPVVIVLLQIRWHKKDRWHDDEDPVCKNCQKELEPHWAYCPYCSYFVKDEE